MTGDARAILRILSLGPRGEGVAQGADGLVFVPGALPGERVAAQIEGGRASLIEILEASPARVAPICPYFGICGGCATQHFDGALYTQWKRDSVVAALAQAGVEAKVGALIDAHGEGRRRATFHARFGSAGSSVGYMQARAHRLVEIDACPILAPAMAGALGAARTIAKILGALGKPLDIAVTATLGGLDIDLRGAGPLDFPLARALIAAAGRLDLARLSNHCEVLIERRAPLIAMGAARVAPPPGGFLQATQEGERVLAALALAVVKGARVADLFCGAGAFALRLAAAHAVHAVDSDALACDALEKAARATPGLRAPACERRDLFRRPLTSSELSRFDTVLFDPPRAGAQAQAVEIAASGVARVIAVSCNAATFARDARLLVEGGYRLDSVTPIDQFRFSPHVEIVGVFTHAPSVRRRKRVLG